MHFSPKTTQLFPGLLAVVLLFWMGKAGAQSLPDSYDLRDVTVSGSTVSWVPAVQDQGLFGDCWSFAAATAMDSSLLMNNQLGPAVSTPPTIEVSSWALSTANGSPESLVGPYYGGNGIESWGGFEYQAMGYVTRGQGDWAIPGTVQSSTLTLTRMGGGPVLDSSPVTPSNAFPTVFENSTPDNISNLIPPVNQTPAFQTLGVTMLDQGFSNNVPLPTPVSPGSTDYNFDMGASDPQVAAVQTAIQKYGAVTTAMNASSYNYFYTVTNANGSSATDYFNPSKDPNTQDHEVTIIGWSNTYTMVDPVTGGTSTGAWLVQNSWGTSGWGGHTSGTNDGTFWVSYNDATIGRVDVAAYQMGSTAGYSPTVLQNELGPLGYANDFSAAQGPLGMAQLQSTTAASILTPTQNGTLTALGVATQVAGVTLTILIYSDWLNGPAGNLLLEQTVTLGGIGYEQITLLNEITLDSGVPIVVELMYGSENAGAVVIGNDGLYGDGGLYSYLDVPTGLSYYYDGTTWQDLASMEYDSSAGSGPDANGGILYLKGILAVPEPGTWCLMLAGGMLLASRLLKARRSAG